MEVCCGYGRNTDRVPEPNNTIIATAEDLYKKCGLKETTTMSVEIPVAKGIDVYIFEGENILDVVSQYNRFSGGGCDVPEWGLGVIYRMYARFTDRDIIKMADEFKQRHIPIDILPDIKIMILEPFVLNAIATKEHWDEFRTEVYKHAEKAKAIAEKYDLTFIPLQDKLKEAEKLCPADYWLRDGVHPTTMGHELIKREWIKAFKTL